MANTILTPTAVTRKALAILHNKLKFIKTINREYDNQFARSGAKIGDTLKIREPNQFTVRSGAIMNAQDVSETSQSLVLGTQKGVDVNFSSVELTLSLDDFAQRILEPAMARLAADVENDVLSSVYKDVYNLTGDPDLEPSTVIKVLDGNARVSQGLAPEGNRHFHLDSKTMAPLVNAVSAFFHKASELERAFTEGFIGMAYGLKWWESNMTPSHTNGSRTDATPVVNTSTQFASGDNTIDITGAGASVTIKKGDVFTAADVFAVNLETKAEYTHLQQWVVTADATADGAGAVTVTVQPVPQRTGAKQNIVVKNAGAGKAVVFAASGGSGDANSVRVQPLIYHRDAFTYVTADLEMPRGVDFAAREVYDGISLRVVRQYDITNDKFPLRLDVLYGFKTIRPEWATRVRG